MPEKRHFLGAQHSRANRSAWDCHWRHSGLGRARWKPSNRDGFAQSSIRLALDWHWPLASLAGLCRPSAIYRSPPAAILASAARPALSVPSPCHTSPGRAAPVAVRSIAGYSGRDRVALQIGYRPLFHLGIVNGEEARWHFMHRLGLFLHQLLG